jgi:hypothetical protein
MPSNKIQATPLMTLAGASLTVNYQSINSPNGLPSACVMLLFSNSSNRDITVSFDGVTDQEYVRASSDKPLLFQNMSEPNNSVALMPATTQIYVKAAGGAGIGTVAVSAYYV